MSMQWLDLIELQWRSFSVGVEFSLMMLRVLLQVTSNIQSEKRRRQFRVIVGGRL